MPKGKMNCAYCQAEIGARRLQCPVCKKKLEKNRTIKRLKFRGSCDIIDWRGLQAGDIIKSIGGHGPYMLITTDDGTEDKVYLSYTGKFKVHKVLEDGISAYPFRNKSESGHCFIYMGREYITPDGLIKQPHRIKKWMIK